MSTSIEKTIQRIRRFSLTCALNNNGKTRHFHNGHEYVEIGGIKWATCNVGAEKPTDSGLYFAWGETQDFTAEQVRNGGKQFNWDNYKHGIYDYLTKYNNTDKKTTLEPQDDAATFNMGIGWRTPTQEEFKTLARSTINEWVRDYQGSGISGRLFTDKNDKSKKLFFPAVGICINRYVMGTEYQGYYWSSSLRADFHKHAFHLLVLSSGVLWSTDNRRYLGFAVRGVVVEQKQ